MQLAVYSATRRAAKEYDHGCAHAPSDVWMWPYSVKVAEARARVDRVCSGIKRLSVVQSQVGAFQTARAQLEDLLEAIKTVRSSRGEFQAIEETPPGESDHGRAALQPQET